MQTSDLTTGDIVVGAIAQAGVDHIFFTSGSEIGFFQEAVSKRIAYRETGDIRIVSVPHEHVSLNAAIGYAAISRKPVAAAAHVDCGTLNFGGGLHTAWRSYLPILIVAGYPPTAFPGSVVGSREEGGHIWLQETRDQHGIVRNYVKWDRRLTSQDSPGMVFSRALQVAMSEPQGPAYVTVPKEVALAPPSTAEYPSVWALTPVFPMGPPPDAVEEIAERLLHARFPVLIVSHSGRNPETVAPLVELCETLSIAVCPARSRGYLSFPLDHELYQSPTALSEADAVVVLEADVPWIPGKSGPPPDAWIAFAGNDPVSQRIPMAEFPADLRVAADPMAFIRALARRVQEMGGPGDPLAVRERRVQLAQRSSSRRAASERDATNAARSRHIEPSWASRCVARILDGDCIVVDDTLPRAQLGEHLRLVEPSSYLGNPGSSGGFAPGAAFGAKLAAPDKTVVAVSGDGFYMFGSPAVALWAASHYAAPFLMVVFTNRSYSTGVTRVAETFGPQGFAARAGFPGGYFDPPIDFAKEADAAGALGISVSDPAELDAALRRGMDCVRAGRPTVVDIRMPRLLQDN